MANYDTLRGLLKLQIRDTGVGIKPEDQEKLFQLFGKLESNSKLNKMGIGLGLYICKKIVEACGGDIYYDTEYLQGASFVFTIHCLRENHEEAIHEEDIRVNNVLRSRITSVNDKS
jgi:signal transduction histidine kinase